MNITHFAGERPTLPTWTTGLWPGTARWAGAVWIGWRIRRAERELHALNDTMLHDMGLTRSEISRAVRGQHRTGT